MGEPEHKNPVERSLDESRRLLEEMDALLSRLRTLMNEYIKPRPKPKLVKETGGEDDQT